VRPWHRSDAPMAAQRSMVLDWRFVQINAVDIGELASGQCRAGEVCSVRKVRRVRKVCR
jgi:hypothetical protein